MNNNNEIINAYIRWRVEEDNWTFLGRDETGARFSVPKTFGLFEHIMLWGGLIALFLFWPAAIVAWILMVISYNSGGPSNYYISNANMEYELEHR